MEKVSMAAPAVAVPVAEKALQRPPRILYMDLLRVLAAFLVIVNHTNSYVFQIAAPGGLTWCLSISWYYISKIAVPLFVMIAGVNLLPRQDTYRRTGQRILRLVLALILFSYLYYVLRVWQTGWTWGSALDIPVFLRMIWGGPITDSYWYLYFYIGLMVMLPLLQRLAKAMKKADIIYLMVVSYVVNALWPLVVHYVPAVQLPEYFDIPLFSIFIGLFFAGHYLHSYAKPKPWHIWACIGAIVASVLLSLGLTWVEYGRLSGTGEYEYWFMDERTAPSATIVACAVATMYLARCLSFRRQEKGKVLSSFAHRTIMTLSRCSFGIYLLQDWVIGETRFTVFMPMWNYINPFLAALVWEVLVFAISGVLAWVLTRISFVRKIV